MCMQDVAIGIKTITRTIVQLDALAFPVLVPGDPSLQSITIHLNQAAAIVNARFDGMPGLPATPVSSSLNPSYPCVIRRADYGWQMDNNITISTTAATPVAIVLQYLDRTVYQTAFNMEL